MQSTIKRNLLIGFGISMLLLIISSVASYNGINNLLKSSRWVSHTDSVLQNLESTLSTLKDAETGQRGFLLTGEDRFLEPYNGAYDKSLSYLANVQSLTADNPAQQASCKLLKEAIKGRLATLDSFIVLKRQHQAISAEQLETGKKYMDEVRMLVKKMEGREQQLLEIRTATLGGYAASTPIIIAVAAFLSIVITIVFFSRINADVDKRARLQQELQVKDADISRRIDIIQSIADKISSGNYNVRTNDEESDGLGSLAISLNKMAESLQYSFGILSDKEWLQAGVAGLNEKMIGEKDIKSLTGNIIRYLAEYTNSQVGGCYLVENEHALILQGGYALSGESNRAKIAVGEGIIGQCAADNKEIVLTNIPADSIMISYAAGAIKPKNIVVIPIVFEHVVNGVIELGSVYTYSKNVLELIKTVSAQVGIAVNSAQSRSRLQVLLEETQAQSEELQSQQKELEALNADLEGKTESLQASEEELRVQQEELQQSNGELEERSRLLEEKNQVIVERNLEIQRKAEELELTTRYKSEFLANMSHELRTPLNSILLLSRLLSDNTEKNLNSEQVESARVIQSSGNGLLSLIDEILDLSKIEAGRMDLEYGDVHINEVVDDMRSLFAPIAREKGLELKLAAAPDAPVLIETDKMRLEQIIKNLISNALKFTTKGSVILQITKGDTQGRMVKFSVTDTGIGIPKEKHSLVFEAFQQADGSTKRKYGGTGLGLSISRELSKLLGGHLTLSSEPGKGSIFSIIVPVVKPEGKAEPAALDYSDNAFTSNRPTVTAVQNSDDEDGYQEVIETSKNRKNQTVTRIPEDVPDDRDSIKPGDKVTLIIEDDTSFARSLLGFARKKGYKGVVAVRGDYAIDMAKQYQPVAILLDIQLPVKDGWQVMEELKTNPATRHIPVHMMSSLTEARKESLQSGAVDFINKPMAMEQVQQMFEKLEEALSKGPRKVLIVEENPKHAKALAYFLESFNISAEIKTSVNDSINTLSGKEVDCVILDMGIPDQNAYATLDAVKKTPGLEHLPIIIFTGKYLSRSEESRIKQYADSIVVKTAHSYQRILDEVALFLHLVEENTKQAGSGQSLKKLVALDDALKNKKVLIADDDVRNIFSLTKALEQHGMSVISAMDGKEALQLLQDKAEVDVVLMDMMMPEMDGYESITKIRQMPQYKQLPILAVTAKAMMGDREKCIAAGASDYISKPVDVDQLLSLLRVWLYGNGR